MTQSTLRTIVHGRVQGVFFRAGTEGQARALDVSGWVRNLPSGSVEVYAVGDKERLQRLLAWLARGPAGARVEHVESEWGETDEPPGSGFKINH